MSLDVTLTAVRPTTVFDANITHNLCAMAEEAGIYKACWRPEEIGITKAAQLIEPLRNGIARVIAQGERIDPRAWSKGNVAAPQRPAGVLREVKVVEPGQDRQLASWMQFRQASVVGAGPIVVQLEGWRTVAWPDGRGNVVFDVEVVQ